MKPKTMDRQNQAKERPPLQIVKDEKGKKAEQKRNERKEIEIAERAVIQGILPMEAERYAPIAEEVLGDGGAFGSEMMRRVFQTCFRLYKADPLGYSLDGDRRKLAGQLTDFIGMPNSWLDWIAGTEYLDKERYRYFAEVVAGNGRVRRARQIGTAAAKSPDPINTLIQGAGALEKATVSPFPDTELGCAERFRADHGDEVRFSYVHNRWYVWTGTHWQEDITGNVNKRASQTARKLYNEALAEPEQNRRETIFRFAKKAESLKWIKSILDLAKPEVPITPDEVNRDDHLFNCANGTLDLHTGILREHRREDLITQVSPVAYDENAKCPLWRSFLKTIFGDDQEIIQFLQRAIGWTLSGDISCQVFFVLLGVGCNGKSTFLEVLRRILGTYSTQASFETFIERRNETSTGHREDLARLAGARMVTAVEAPKGKRLDMRIIKSLTGGESIAASFKYGREFLYQPKMHLWLCGNHEPRITDSSLAAWRRMVKIPFDVVIEKPDIDRDLPAKLADELPGILRWCVDGALAFKKLGKLDPPKKVVTATEDYRLRQDQIGRFLSSRCELDPNENLKRKDILEEYRRWCTDEGEEPIGAHGFTDALFEKKIPVKQGSKGLYWANGVRMKTAKELKKS